MDRETLIALGERLKESITISAGPQIARLLPPTFIVEGCDDTFAKTTVWLTANGHDIDASLRWLKRHGAACDCQTLTNIIYRLDEEF
jgi:hypothetical protein